MKSHCHSICPTNFMSHFCPKILSVSGSKGKAAPAVDWQGLCDLISSKMLLTHMSLLPSTIVFLYLLSLTSCIEKKSQSLMKIHRHLFSPPYQVFSELSHGKQHHSLGVRANRVYYLPMTIL